MFQSLLSWWLMFLAGTYEKGGFGCDWSGGSIVKLSCKDLIGQMRPILLRILHQQQPFYKTPLRSLSWPMRPLETKWVGLQGPENWRICSCFFLGDAPPARSGYHGASFFVGRFVESFTCHWDKNIPMCVSMNSAPNSVFVWTSGF